MDNQTIQRLRKQAVSKAREIISLRKQKEEQELVDKELKKLETEEQKEEQRKVAIANERHELLTSNRIAQVKPTFKLKCHKCKKPIERVFLFLRRSLTTEPPQIRVYGACPVCRLKAKYTDNEKYTSVITAGILDMLVYDRSPMLESRLEKYFNREVN